MAYTYMVWIFLEQQYSAIVWMEQVRCHHILYSTPLISPNSNTIVKIKPPKTGFH